MKFKLDENPGTGVARILRESGHDVSTVPEQKLHGATDDTIYGIFRRERRCLVTLDLDFGNVLRFPPEPTAGIAVLRPPGKAILGIIAALTRQLVKALDKGTPRRPTLDRRTRTDSDSPGLRTKRLNAPALPCAAPTRGLRRAGYEHLLEALRDPKYEEMREWIGGEFNPEGFDLGKVNQGLWRIK